MVVHSHITFEYFGFVNNFVIKTVELAKYEDLDKNCLDLRTYNIVTVSTLHMFFLASLWSYIRISDIIPIVIFSAH